MDTTRVREIRSVIARGKRWDLVFAIVGIVCLMIGLLTVAALFIDMAVKGLPRISLEFFTNFPSRRAESAGILSAWVGSTLVMVVTAVTAVPIGVAAGVYLEEYAPRNWMTDVIEINITHLAGVPSIVYGLLALGLFVYQFGLGQSVLAAGLTLALLILPVVIVATREAIRAIPAAMREGSYALGATKWQTVWHQVLPAAFPGILTGLILALSRTIGETAPLITIGALTYVPFAPTDVWSPFTVLPIQIFNWVSRPQAAFAENAAAGIVVLLGLLLVMNAGAIVVRDRLQKRSL
jgi:phosphate transport system permease protein